jgi:peptide/nickel transport system permease protein
MTDPQLDVASRRQWTRRLARSRSALVGGALITLAVIVALTADWIAPYRPNELVAAQFQKPSGVHWLGTDSVGHDVLSRVLHGSRLSLLAGLVSVALALLVGVPAGLAAGYFGGRIDTLVMRSVDVLLAFPPILVAMVLVVALEPSWTTVMLAIGLVNVPVFARQVRASVLGLRQQDYILASRAAGAGPGHILLRGILPALVSPIVVLATLGLGTAILEVAGLSFLGISGQPDAAEWGSMLRSAKDTLRASIWPAAAPGAAISLTVLGFSLLGDGLRDALDPRSQLASAIDR